MSVTEAIERRERFLKENCRPASLDRLRFIHRKMNEHFGDRGISTITPEEVSAFLDAVCAGCTSATRYTRFSQIKALFNFCADVLELPVANPCRPRLFRMKYRNRPTPRRPLLSEDSIEALIGAASNERNRLLMKVMATAGLRVGEAVRLRPCDIDGRVLFIRSPKSGADNERAFITKEVARELRRYIKQKGIKEEGFIFPISKQMAMHVIRSAGRRIGLKIQSHDLRRHCASFWSRKGMPLVLIQKVLRHRDIKTTMSYIAEVHDEEILRWQDRFMRTL